VTVPVTSANGGGGTVLCNAGPCGGSFAAGTQITVTASPDLVSTFANWTNATGSAVAANCTTNTICGPFQLTGTTTITANFKRPTLTVNVVGTGTVNSNQASINNCTTNCSAAFDKGTSITLTTSSAGFSGWSGGGCSGTGPCGPILLTADTTVTATFSAVSQVTNFKFIGAPGQPLLAIDPRSPAATPPAIKVNNTTVTLSAGSDGGGSTIVSGTYNQITTSFENLVANTILFPSQGKLYRASTKISDGVPGNGGNEPVQVSSRSTTTICGVGSILDPTNQNPIVGYSDAGVTGICNDADDFIVLMHLQDPSTTAATLLPIGTSIEGNMAVYNLANGSLDHVIVVNSNGNLQWMGDNMVRTDIPGGGGIGIVTIVARQPGKVFLANATNLYSYDPVAHTLNAIPVVSADPGQTWVLNQNGDNELKVPADGTAIYPVQTNGKVFKVSLTTATATTLFIPPPTITKATDVEQTANRIIIHTGTRSFGNNGVADPCVAANTCNNGIIAVSKTNGQFVVIEPAASAKQINNLMSFNDYVLYTASVPNVSGGAFARDENATNPRDRQGYWSNGVLNKTLNVVSNQQSVLRALLVEPPLCTPQCVVNGTLVKAFDLPTTITPRTLGTVSDTGLLQFAPFFRKSINNGMIGTANLVANPLSNQPFFVDTTVSSSLVKIPTAAANWRDVGSNLE
jgi:Divergent InlB B-repeat domain